MPEPYFGFRNFRYPQGLIELERPGVRMPEFKRWLRHPNCMQLQQLRKSLNVAKVGIGGDDGHDEHNDGEQR